MDIFDSGYYKINKFYLCFYGLWVFQTDRNKLLRRSFCFLSLTSTLFIQFRFVFAVYGEDLDAILECIPPLNLTLLAFFQHFIYCYKEKKLLILVKCIKYDWKLWSTQMESTILKKFAQRGRNFTVLFAGYIYVTVFTFIATSLMPIFLDFVLPLNETRPKQLMYPAKYPFDHDKNMNLILVHGGLTAFYNMSVIFNTEAMLAVTIQHACGLYAIVGYRLKNSLKLMDSKMIGSNESGEKLLYKEMSFSIQCHNYAIKYSKVLESMFAPFFFIALFGNLLTTSCLLIQALNYLDQFDKLIKFGTLSLAVIIHVFMMSLLGENLIEYSSRVVHDAFEENWYDMPRKSRKLLTMITLQSYVPRPLTAGKIIPINMVTFSQILKTSISYFTVLRSMRQTPSDVDLL